MKIYCAGAIKGDITFQQYYREIIEIINNEGHLALSELNKELFTTQKLTDREIFTRDIQWLKESDLMVAEISGPSLGVGFEISFALYVLNIPVLALHRIDSAKVSAMITGCTSDLIAVRSYTDSDELKSVINNFILYNTPA
ncbi:MAG: nucleoside 2-deoxyribosyltransferase [Ignavibacteriales bacterium]|nr:MAG: nucleoside 2-deoxyribosyltransferase [Ignavibacteriales bacterium]